MAPLRCTAAAVLLLLVGLEALLCTSGEKTPGGGLCNQQESGLTADGLRADVPVLEGAASEHHMGAQIKDRLVDSRGRSERQGPKLQQSSYEDGHLSDAERAARLAALEGTLLEQEELVLKLVRLLDLQREQVSELRSNNLERDCSCPCRQLAQWRTRRSDEGAREHKNPKPLAIVMPEPLLEPALPKGPVNEAAPSLVQTARPVSEVSFSLMEILVAFDTPEKPSSLVGFQERLVVRPRVAWGDHFKLLAAVEVGAEISCLHTLHQVWLHIALLIWVVQSRQTHEFYFHGHFSNPRVCILFIRYGHMPDVYVCKCTLNQIPVQLRILVGALSSSPCGRFVAF
jgi:hypothetical protein